MNRESEAELLNFCADQHVAFDPAAWIRYPANPLELTAVALFLAGVDWFGHRAALLEVAERLHPGSTGRFAELAKRTWFDCARFSNLLQRHLTKSTHAHVAS